MGEMILQVLSLNKLKFLKNPTEIQSYILGM